MAPKVTQRAARIVAQLAELSADERAEVLDVARALPTPPVESAAEQRVELLELLAEVKAGRFEGRTVEEIVRDARAALDF